MVLKRINSLLLISSIALSALAVPAKKGPIVRTLPDGTEKTIYLHGNAFSHYMTDAEGTWLDEETLAPMSAEDKAAREALNVKRAQARRAQQAERRGISPNPAPRGLLIMVNFTNKEFVTSRDIIDWMLNGDDFWRDYTYVSTYEGKSYKERVECNGSARKYFQDQSYGKYSPVFDVVGPFTVSHEYAYYGKNNDARAGYMIKEACELADAAGVDFTRYDNNNDGKVDFVYVLYAGYGEADSGDASTIWPHNASLDPDNKWGGITCLVDGKLVDSYACSSEINYYNDKYNGIGTFCHEFSHVLGLPDLYETNYNSKGLHTLFEWDILDYGAYLNDGNTPPSYSSYERFYMGWLTPRVLKSPQSVWLNRLNREEGGDAILLCEGDQHNLVGHNPEPKVFYMLEARIKDGWDTYLPGKGMLITKVSYDADSWEYNTVNNSASKMGVDIIEAQPNTKNYANYKDAYPYGASSWTSFSGHEVTDIEFDPVFGSTTFSYRGAAKDAIEDVQSDKVQCTKVVRDGHIVIVRGDKEYDILGRVK